MKYLNNDRRLGPLEFFHICSINLIAFSYVCFTMTPFASFTLFNCYCRFCLLNIFGGLIRVLMITDKLKVLMIFIQYRHNATLYSSADLLFKNLLDKELDRRFYFIYFMYVN